MDEDYEGARCGEGCAPSSENIFFLIFKLHNAGLYAFLLQTNYLWLTTGRGETLNGPLGVAGRIGGHQVGVGSGHEFYFEFSSKKNARFFAVLLRKTIFMAKNRDKGGRLTRPMGG